MPDPNQSAANIIQQADTKGETAAGSALGNAFLPDVDIQATLDPQSFVRQSKDIATQAFQRSGLPEAFQRVRRTGEKAAGALDIVTGKIRQDELAKIPLEEMQNEIDSLNTQRFAVFPNVLADDNIKDFRGKIRVANKIQGLFDAEINELTAKKRQLEDAADKRAQLKVSELQAQANILDKQLQNDQFELARRMDLFTTGQATLQDILEQAVSMAENNAKRSGAAANNMFIGQPGGAFTDYEIAQFLAFEAFGSFQLTDKATTNQKGVLAQRYQEWVGTGKPLNDRVMVEGPAESFLGPRPTQARTARDEGFQNPFATPAEAKKEGDILSQFVQAGLIPGIGVKTAPGAVNPTEFPGG